MAKDKRYFVTCTMEVYVPDQGCGDKALKNEDLDAFYEANLAQTSCQFDTKLHLLVIRTCNKHLAAVEQLILQFG